MDDYAYSLSNTLLKVNQLDALDTEVAELSLLAE
jgi:hypothetical protein